MLTKPPVRNRDKILEIPPQIGFGLGMTKLEPHIDETGRYLNIHQASQIVRGVTEKTLWNWANEGETKFGFKLRVKRVPVEHHRYHRKDEAPAKNPRKDRMLILEADVFALKKILEAAGRTAPGPWSPYEMATLEARANAVQRLGVQRLGNLHLK